MNPSLSPLLSEALRLLRLLRGSRAEEDLVTVQTFDDTPAKTTRLARVFHVRPEDLESLEPELTRLASQGAGIHLLHSVTDGSGAGKKAVVRPTAFWVDFDGTEPDADLLALLPEPTATVQSKNGKHLYWALDNKETLETREFETINKRLAYFLGSDPKVFNIDRAMRAPGSFHQKDPSDPFRVSLVSENAGTRVTAASFAALLPPLPSQRRSRKPGKPDTSETSETSETSGGPRPEKLKDYLKGRSAEERIEAAFNWLRGSQQGSRNSDLFVTARELYHPYVSMGLGFLLRQGLDGIASYLGLSAEETAATIDSAWEKGATETKGLSPIRLRWLEFEQLFQTLSYNERTRALVDEGSEVSVTRLWGEYTETYNSKLSLATFETEVLAWAQYKRGSDPLRDHLDQLPEISEEEALSVFSELSEVMGYSGDTESWENRMIRKHRIGLVARTYQPGAPMQWALGVVGAAGTGKSSFFDNYLPPSLAEYQYSLGQEVKGRGGLGKDAHQAIAASGLTVIEEIDTVHSPADFATLKALLSARSQHLRLPYERSTTTLPYRHVWGFTSNSATPLGDDGAQNRRYVVLRLSGTMADGVARAQWYRDNCDRLLAAACALYRAGHTWTLTHEELEHVASQQEDVIERSGASVRLANALPDIEETFYGTPEAPKEGVAFLQSDLSKVAAAGDRLDRAAQADIPRALENAGWVRVKRRWKKGASPVAMWIPGWFDLDREGANPVPALQRDLNAIRMMM